MKFPFPFSHSANHRIYSNMLQQQWQRFFHTFWLHLFMDCSNYYKIWSQNTLLWREIRIIVRELHVHYFQNTVATILVYEKAVQCFGWISSIAVRISQKPNEGFADTVQDNNSTRDVESEVQTRSNHAMKKRVSNYNEVQCCVRSLVGSKNKNLD